MKILRFLLSTAIFFPGLAQALECTLAIPSDDVFAECLKTHEQPIKFNISPSASVQRALIDTYKAKIRVDFETVSVSTPPVYELRLTVSRKNLSMSQKDGTPFSIFDRSVDAVTGLALASNGTRELQVHVGVSAFDEEYGRGLFYGVLCKDLSK